MSALKSKRQFLLLPVLAALLIGAFVLFQPPSKESPADTRQVVSEEVSAPITTAQIAANEAAPNSHPADCAHCNPVSVEDQVVAKPVLKTKPQFDSLFKEIAKQDTLLSRADFDFLKGSTTGQAARFAIDGQTFNGTIGLVREGNFSSTYTVAVEGGLLTITINRNNGFSAYLMLNGDSRVVSIEEYTQEDPAGDLLASEASVSDYLCAPEGAVYPLNAPQPVPLGGLAVGSAKQYPPLAAAASIALTSDSTSGHVLYLDFDGEEVTGDWWNTISGVDTINALPHPRANDDAFVTAVWLRVVEDFAPFNITVTTDEAVYLAAVASERYLHMIITPTTDVAPGAGGVANLGSYSDRDTGIAWTFNQDEYSCSATISHEAGHAFGLSHDGPGPAPFAAYYGGHNTAYSPGWAPIMGAPWNDELTEYQLEEVVQWSRGDYADADNQEDDVALIAGANNGFGFVADDYADAYDAGGALDVGLLGDTGLNEVGATGLISTSVDVDVFRFSAAYTGEITLTVSPFDVDSSDPELGSETQGADLAVQIRLLDENGVVLAAGVDAGPVDLASEIQVDVEAGIHYLEVTGAGRGGDNPETAFDDYGSLGQYTIVGDLPTPPLAVFGGDKQTDPVIFGDTETQQVNGTDYGFSYPSNGAIVHTFLLVNKESTPLTNISVSFATDIDFEVVQAPPATLPGDGQIYMSIAYDPQQSGANGIDYDTVMISYEAAEAEVFEFAVSGTSTQSADKDNYEDNDRWTDATDLTEAKDTWLSDYKGLAFFRTSIRDMYEIDAGHDELITVAVAYDATDGPITFELHNDFEVLGSTSAEDGIIQFRVPVDFFGGQMDFVIIATNTADSSVYNAYDLRWSSISLVAGDDDLYEDNNTQDQAFDLTGAFSTRLSEYLGEGISKDTDWYKLTVPADPYVRMLYVAAEFTHADGDINIEVVDENGFSFIHPLTSATENDREVVTLHHGVATADFAENFSPEGNAIIMGVEPGDYYVRVYGDFASNSYDLVVEALTDDRYEVVDVVDGEEIENDDRENAFYLGDTIIDHWLYEVDGIGTCASYGANATQESFIYGSDDDWYQFDVDASAEQLTIEFTSFDGGTMIFQLYDSDGTFLADSTEPIAGGTLILNSDLMTLVSVDTTYYLRVFPFTDISALSGYDFRVSYSTESPVIEGAVEDNYEENDNFRELFNLTGNEGLWLSSLSGYGTQLDPDWFQISVPEGATKLTVKCSLDAAEGALSLDVSRKDGPTVATSTGGSDLETIVIDNPTPGQYAIAVLGEGRGNNYNLFWDVVLPEDNYEENDTRETAFDLTGYERKLLRKLDGLGIQKDEDWYHIYAGAGTAELRATATFAHAEGDIDMELYNEDGYLFSRAVSTDDHETIIYENPPVGDYYVRIYYGNEGNEYDFSWAALNAAEVARIRFGEDNYEENDTQATAFVLSSDQPRLSNLDGLGSQADDDWFEITIPEGNLGLYVECLFDGGDSDVDFEIYDDSGIAIIRRDSVTDNEVLDLTGSMIPGTYHIRVYGPNIGTPYDLYFVAKVEDIFEENDNKDEAYDITSQEGLPLSDIGIPNQSDDDWYVIDVTGDYPYIKVTLDYVHLNGSIDFQVRDATGTNILYTADSTEDSETTGLLVVEPGLNYIYVYGDDAYNTYDLTWELFQDDDYEENDSFGAAADITAEPSIDAVQFDDDWFKITVPVSNAYLAVLATFTGADGNIDLALYDAAGDLILDGDQLVDPDFGSITLPVTAGNYFVKISGDNVNENYTLSWKVDEDDIYDEDSGNDTIGDASDFTGFKDVLVPDLRQFDEDWYRVVVMPGEVSLLVDLEFTHSEGDLNCAIYDAAGLEVAAVDTDTDNELLLYGPNPFGDPAGDTYYIKVSGQGFGTEYTLTWNASVEDIYEGEGGNNSYDDSSSDLLDSEGIRISDSTGYATSYDEDWYLVEIASGDDGIVIEASFTHAADANLDIELFDDNQFFKARSVGFGDSERIHFKGAAGTYRLRVFNNLSGNPYDLYWNSYKEDVLESSGEYSKQEKKDEQNDTPDDPRRLLQTTMNASYYPGVEPSGDPSLKLYLLDGLTQLDEDWYAVEVDDQDDIFIVNLDFDHLGGDVDVAVYNRDTEVLVAQAESETDGEYIVVRDLDAGDYLICVYGYGILNPKKDLGWTFDPYTEDYVSLVDNLDPGEGSNYNLAEGNAYGLANTYALRWNSTVEDIYDVDITNVDEINDDVHHRAVPPLFDNYGDEDDDGWIDSTPKPRPPSGPDEYIPEYYYHDLVQFDEDWYEFDVDSGGGLPHQLYARIDFEHVQGDLALYVYDASLLDPDDLAGGLIDDEALEAALIGSSNTDTDVEFIEYFSATAKTYYIRVIGEDLGSPYVMTIRAFDDDLYEENDSFTDASDINALRGISLSGLVQRDDDYYFFSIPKDQVHLFASQIDIIGDEDVTSTVYNAEQTALPSQYYLSRVVAPDEALYYIKVTGDNIGTSYGLYWDYDNEDEYDQRAGGDNGTSDDANDLTRNRLEPTYNPQATYRDPIKELRFDYNLFDKDDPFGHAIQEGDDWYALRIPAWKLDTAKQGNKNISVLKRDYYVQLLVDLEFVHEDGRDINMEIYESTDLSNPIGRSETLTDNESLSVGVDTINDDTGLVYYVKVYGDNADKSYELTWDVTTDDGYEGEDSNNFVELAFDLTHIPLPVDAAPGAMAESTEGMLLHEIEYFQDVTGNDVIDGDDGGFTARIGYGNQTGDDWYAVVTSGDADEISVECRFYSDDDTGYTYALDNLDIDIELYFLASNVGASPTLDVRKPVLVGRSFDDTLPFNDNGVSKAEDVTEDWTDERIESKTFNIEDTGDGIYYIRVYYDNRLHPYTLLWDDIGDADNDGDFDIYDDYLNGDWTFSLTEDLPAALLASPNANGDGDAMPNWAEFALALNASVADTAVVGQSIVEINEKQYYQFEFLRRKEAVAYGYQFIVEETPNLVFDDTRAVLVGSESVSADVERVMYRCSKSMDEQDQCFFRLKVEEPVAKD